MVLNEKSPGQIRKLHKVYAALGRRFKLEFGGKSNYVVECFFCDWEGRIQDVERREAVEMAENHLKENSDCLNGILAPDFVGTSILIKQYISVKVVEK